MRAAIVTCHARDFAFEALQAALAQEYPFYVYRGSLTWQSGERCINIFDFGCLMTWGLSDIERQQLVSRLTPFMQVPHPQAMIDEFTFAVTGVPEVRNDHIGLASDDAMEKLALAFALAQSVKLDEFEQRASQTIDDTFAIPKRISDTGKSGLSRKQIAQLRGRLFVAQSDINLKFDLLDTPEFFWEFPEFENRYTLMANYLDVKHRVEVLNKRLEVIHGILEMLAEEQNHNHSATLEWIIIWLIAFEVVIFFAHDIFKLF